MHFVYVLIKNDLRYSWTTLWKTLFYDAIWLIPNRHIFHFLKLALSSRTFKAGDTLCPLTPSKEGENSHFFFFFFLSTKGFISHTELVWYLPGDSCYVVLPGLFERIFSPVLSFLSFFPLEQCQVWSSPVHSEAVPVDVNCL